MMKVESPLVDTLEIMTKIKNLNALIDMQVRTGAKATQGITDLENKCK